MKEIPSSFSKQLGLNIKKYRILNGLTQQKLAERLGYKARGTISDWERGKATPGIYELRRISALLDVPLEILIPHALGHQ